MSGNKKSRYVIKYDSTFVNRGIPSKCPLTSEPCDKEECMWYVKDPEHCAIEPQFRKREDVKNED